MEKEYQIDDQIEAYCRSCAVIRPQIVSGLGANNQITRSKCPSCGNGNRYKRSSIAAGGQASEPQKLATPYLMSGNYEQGSILEHPSFGRGEVVRLIGFEKIEVLFRDRLRCLVHGREATSNQERKQ